MPCMSSWSRWFHCGCRAADLAGGAASRTARAVLRVLLLPVLGETSVGVCCPVVTGRGGDRAACERGLLPTGVYPALGTHTTSKSARRHIVTIALFEGYLWGTGRV
jgi:hypothetical protein